MNCHCQKCGAEISGKDLSNKTFPCKSEIGLDLKERIYICPKCGAEHVICPECQGWTYHTKEDDFYDCETCYGMGVILTSEIYQNE